MLPPRDRRTERRSRIEDYLAATTLPPLSAQSLSVFTSVMPWPLQPFWPLQALLAPWHEPWPLHSLMPAHFTALADAFFAFSLAWAAPEASSEPTAAAITAPFIISLTIISLSGWDWVWRLLGASLATCAYVTIRRWLGARRRECLRASRCRAGGAPPGSPPPLPRKCPTRRGGEVHAPDRRRARATKDFRCARAARRWEPSDLRLPRVPRAQAARRS